MCATAVEGATVVGGATAVGGATVVGGTTVVVVDTKSELLPLYANMHPPIPVLPRNDTPLKM